MKRETYKEKVIRALRQNTEIKFYVGREELMSAPEMAEEIVKNTPMGREVLASYYLGLRAVGRKKRLSVKWEDKS